MVVDIKLLIWFASAIVGIVGLFLAIMRWNDSKRTELRDELYAETKDIESMVGRRLDAIKRTIKEDYLEMKIYTNDQGHNNRRVEVLEQAVIEIKTILTDIPTIKRDLHRLCIKEGLDSSD